MSKRGDQARESAKDIIINAFSEKNAFVAFQDKKIYIKVPDGPGGELIQLAITMTMPKTPVTAAAGTQVDRNDGSAVAAEKSQIIPTELSPGDRAKVQELMERLGVK